MGTLIKAIQTGGGLTHNSAATNTSTGDALVDLFGKIGSMRTATESELIALFSKAFGTDPEKALKILFWSRDIRGGAGERRIFRVLTKYLANEHTEFIKENMNLIPGYGRWDDVLEFIGTPLEKKALWLIHYGLTTDNLCRKWMPRRGPVAKKISMFLKLTPKEYRKLLVGGPTVEQKMSANDWDGIEYEKVPSLAMSRYARAFGKHNSEAWQEFKSSPEKIKSVKAEALYPYDVIKSTAFGDAEVSQAQWENLPDYVPEGEMFLPLVDTSGSMTYSVGKNLTCLDIAVSLGLYLSERNVGPFKDHFITFSAQPQLQSVAGPLKDRVRQMQSAHWEMNTDLNAAFELILRQAMRNNVPANEMPTKLIILSDMEFDPLRGFGPSGGFHRQGVNFNPTAQEMIRNNYEKSGYAVPAIVYWNIRGRIGNDPVRFDENGAQWVSGFSPAIMKACLKAEEPEVDTRTPYDIMMEVISQERYEPVRVPA